jgi:hypothetical protein
MVLHVTWSLVLADVMTESSCCLRNMTEIQNAGFVYLFARIFWADYYNYLHPLLGADEGRNDS